MKITREGDHYRIVVSEDELATLNDSVLAAIENLDEVEFRARVGVEMSEGKRIVEQIVKAYREKPPHRTTPIEG